jgi:hypothetical protein
MYMENDAEVDKATHWLQMEAKESPRLAPLLF